MPSNCAVAPCKNLSKKDNSLHFFTFPKNPTLRSIWINFCDRNCYFNANTSRICSQHFLKNDFLNLMQHNLLGNVGKLLLKKTAIPTQKIIPAKEDQSSNMSSKRHDRKSCLSKTDLPIATGISVDSSEPNTLRETSTEKSDERLKYGIAADNRLEKSNLPKEIAVHEEFTNAHLQTNFNMNLSMIGQEIVNLTAPSISSENGLEPMSFVSTGECRSENIYDNLPNFIIKEEIINPEEFTNAPQAANITTHLPMIKQEIVNLPESPNQLEEPNLPDPIVEKKMPREEDQYDIFGKFVASELRCTKSEATRKQMKLKILKILMDAID